MASHFFNLSEKQNRDSQSSAVVFHGIKGCNWNNADCVSVLGVSLFYAGKFKQ